MKKWIKEEEGFIRANWFIMNINQLTVALNEKFKTNRSKASVDCKIDKMNLAKKRLYSRKNEANDETRLEIEGRKRTEQLKKIGNMIDLYEKIEIKVISDQQGNIPTRFINGTVIGKNNEFITLQTDNYKESLLYIDFYTRRAVII